MRSRRQLSATDSCDVRDFGMPPARIELAHSVSGTAALMGKISVRVSRNFEIATGT
jgi:hypothetical protein